MTINDMTGRPETPNEWTYLDYRSAVIDAGESALEAMAESPEDYPEPHDAVRYVVEGDQLVTDYGYTLVVVRLTDQNPDAPDYCDSWDHYVDDDDTSWSAHVRAMAYVAYYSDVMDYVVRTVEAAAAEALANEADATPGSDR